MAEPSFKFFNSFPLTSIKKIKFQLQTWPAAVLTYRPLLKPPGATSVILSFSQPGLFSKCLSKLSVSFPQESFADSLHFLLTEMTCPSLERTISGLYLKTHFNHGIL